jgi:hypothetical protein
MAQLSAALDAKEALLSSLRRMHGEAEASGAPGAELGGSFREEYASLIMQLHQAGLCVAERLAALRQRSAFHGEAGPACEPSEEDRPPTSDSERPSSAASLGAGASPARRRDDSAVNAAVNAALRLALARGGAADGGRRGPPAGGAACPALRAARADADALVRRLMRGGGTGSSASHASAISGAGAGLVKEGSLVSSCVALLNLLRSLADAPGSVSAGEGAAALGEAMDALRPRSLENGGLWAGLLATMAEIKELMSIST